MQALEVEVRSGLYSARQFPAWPSPLIALSQGSHGVWIQGPLYSPPRTGTYTQPTASTRAVTSLVPGTKQEGTCSAVSHLI